MDDIVIPFVLSGFVRHLCSDSPSNELEATAISRNCLAYFLTISGFSPATSARYFAVIGRPAFISPFRGYLSYKHGLWSRLLRLRREVPESSRPTFIGA